MAREDEENYRAKDREEERNRALKREGAKRDVNGCLSRESSAILCSLSAAAIEREEFENGKFVYFEEPS